MGWLLLLGYRQEGRCIRAACVRAPVLNLRQGDYRGGEFSWRRWDRDRPGYSSLRQTLSGETRRSPSASWRRTEDSPFSLFPRLLSFFDGSIGYQFTMLVHFSEAFDERPVSGDRERHGLPASGQIYAHCQQDCEAHLCLDTAAPSLDGFVPCRLRV